jgi:hypothetical protein
VADPSRLITSMSAPATARGAATPTATRPPLLALLAEECRRSAQTLDDVALERAALARGVLTSWQGPAADEFRTRGRRADLEVAEVVADLRRLAGDLDRAARTPA